MNLTLCFLLLFIQQNNSSYECKMNRLYLDLGTGYYVYFINNYFKSKNVYPQTLKDVYDELESEFSANEMKMVELDIL